jgi:hypothetical protein
MGEKFLAAFGIAVAVAVAASAFHASVPTIRIVANVIDSFRIRFSCFLVFVFSGFSSPTLRLFVFDVIRPQIGGVEFSMGAGFFSGAALGDRMGEMRGPDHDRFHLAGGRHEGGGSQRIGERLRCNSCHKLRLFLDEHAFERDVVPECARADMLQSLRRPNPSCAPETRAARPLWTTPRQGHRQPDLRVREARRVHRCHSNFSC